MYGIVYLHEWLIFMVNVGKYSIHGAHGIVFEGGSFQTSAKNPAHPICQCCQCFGLECSRGSRCFLGGGFKYFVYVHPYLGKMNPFWRTYFSDGLQPSTSFDFWWCVSSFLNDSCYFLEVLVTDALWIVYMTCLFHSFLHLFHYSRPKLDEMTPHKGSVYPDYTRSLIDFGPLKIDLKQLALCI